MIQAVKLNIVLFFQRIINTLKLKYLIYYIEKIKYSVYKQEKLNSNELLHLNNNLLKMNRYLIRCGYADKQVYYQATQENIRSILCDLITIQRELLKLS